VVWPCDPRGRVRRPLGRHAKRIRRPDQSLWCGNGCIVVPRDDLRVPRPATCVRRPARHARYRLRIP
jgi:hypothetical protein